MVGLAFSPERHDAPVVDRINLPLGNLFSGAAHSGKHDSDGQDDFKRPPLDVHVIALNAILGDVPHKNWQSTVHANLLFTLSRAAQLAKKLMHIKPLILSGNDTPAPLTHRGAVLEPSAHCPRADGSFPTHAETLTAMAWGETIGLH
jgi:hypothetical protein